MKALIIIDMLKDFVDGKLANPKALEIVGPLKALLAHARRQGWVVVFSNDAHQPGDPELKVWGPHAMQGDPGAQVIDALAPAPGPREFISDKRSYGAFDGTGLDERLKALGVNEVVVTGQHTHICVRHSSYGALIRGYTITVPQDAVCAFGGVNEDEALKYLKDVYAAEITTTGALMGEPVAAR
jgi:nicotinamidase-related amidase